MVSRGHLPARSMILTVLDSDPSRTNLKQLETYLGYAAVLEYLHVGVGEDVPHHNTPILCLGEAAWVQQGGPKPFTDWTGYTIPGSHQVYGVDHLSKLKENPKLLYPTIRHFQKLGRLLRGEWPRPIPPIHQFGSRTQDTQWFTGALQARWITVDTEYDVQRPGIPGTLKLIGLYYHGAPSVLSCWWPCHPYTSQFRDLYSQLVSQVPVVMWNAMADLPVIEAAMGVTYAHYHRIDDPMLRHALLWSESPHSLEYCASIDGAYPKFKHLMDTDLVTYNAGDVLETDHLEEVYRAQIEADPPLRRLYEEQSLKLIPVILRSRSVGIKVDIARCLALTSGYRALVQEAVALATAATGWPINLSSPEQVKHWLYEVCGYDTQTKKAKGKKAVSTNEDALNALRATYSMPFEAEYEEKEGLSLDYISDRIGQGADPFLEALACHRGAVGVLNNYLYGVCQAVYHARTDKEAKAAREALRQREITQEDICDRIYPDMKIHAQANGRWSVTDPPVAGMPKELHSMLVPEDGHAWLMWDFKQIEPRLGAATSRDWPRLKAFEAGRDIYQDGCLEAFGKFSKVLRQLFKQVDLSLSYGKKPRNLHHIPGIMAYGFSKAQLEQAAWNYLRAHPQRVKWMEQLEAQVKETHEVRDHAGRLRRLQGHPDNQIREALNMPMQAGVTSYTNAVVVRIAQELPWSRLVMNRFDEQWVEVPLDKIEESRRLIRQVLNQTLIVGGVAIKLPWEPEELEVKYAPDAKTTV